MTRRRLLQMAACGAFATSLQARAADPASPALAHAREPFPWDETPIADLQAAMASGKTSALAITRQYLARIAAIDKATVNGEGWPFGLQHIERLESLSCSILQ